MHRSITVGIVFVVACAALVALAGGSAAAGDHYDDIEYDDVDYTVEFPDDRTPGEEVSVIERARSPVDVRNLDTARIFTPMNADPCADGDIRAFGIDRGSNNEGTEVDEGLVDNYKDDYEGEVRVDDPPLGQPYEIWADFWDEEDFQDGTDISTEDTIILYREDCYITPEEPGWYQSVGKMNGTSPDGEQVEGWAKSEYFWIGDFEDEEEAREELGPPPSERTDDDTEPADDASTPTPGSDDAADDESTPQPADDTAGDDGDADAGDATDDDGDATDDDGDTDAEAGAADDDAGQAATDDNGETDADGASTPGVGDGPGFGPVAAVAALLAAAIATRRR